MQAIKSIVVNIISKILHIICFICFGYANSLAQTCSLTLRGNDKDRFLELSKLPSQFHDFNECKEQLFQAHLNLLKQGYLTVSIDSLIWNETQAQAFVQLGEKFVWGKLRNGNIPTSVLLQSNFEAKTFLNKVSSVKKLTPIYENMIRYFEDHGYPFASIRLDSIEINEQTISGALMLDKGPLIRIDTIILNEDAKIDKAYIMQYLGIQQGDYYNESKIRDISKKLQQLSFAQEAYPWRLEFNLIKTKLNLFVKTKSANRADVLLGLLPNNTSNDGKFLLTGDVKLAFVNALGRGEHISANWQNLQYKSPRYNFEFQYPYLLNSPIGVGAKFDFYKRDTAFKNVNGELGLLYAFNANDKLKLSYELSSSRLLSVNIADLIYRRTLPENVDVKYKTFGLEAVLSRLDYNRNPRKGYRIQLNGGISFRNLIRNPVIESTIDAVAQKPFAYLYDSIQTKTTKYIFKAEIGNYISFNKRIVFATIYHGGIAYCKDELFRNELFQIGGFRLLRGFDEGSLFVNQYQIATIEPRYLLSLNSYFFVFSDFGFIQSKYYKIKQNVYPYSLGLGMSFENKAGLFNISYAVGGNNKENIQLRRSKVHFGYISYF
ncbi:MAG: BamA/TamA family outer membrane protein [Bacteroidetes bacterium]|nr:BamA/TamA family outer membrane protein [Bacteroidota bacterium]